MSRGIGDYGRAIGLEDLPWIAAGKTSGQPYRPLPVSPGPDPQEPLRDELTRLVEEIAGIDRQLEQVLPALERARSRATLDPGGSAAEVDALTAEFGALYLRKGDAAGRMAEVMGKLSDGRPTADRARGTYVDERAGRVPVAEYAAQ